MSKPLPKKPDGSLDTSGDLGNNFDDLLDELHSSPSRARSTGEPTRAEVDEVRRIEAAFLAGVTGAANERLRSDGLSVVRVYDDRTDGVTFALEIRDRSGRSYDASVTVSELISLGERYGEQMGRHVVDLLVREAKEARERYFRRML